MQALFYMDVSGSRWQPGLKLFNACFASQNKVPSFFLELVRGVAVCRKEIDRVVDRLKVIVNANRELEQYHRGRLHN